MLDFSRFGRNSNCPYCSRTFQTQNYKNLRLNFGQKTFFYQALMKSYNKGDQKALQDILLAFKKLSFKRDSAYYGNNKTKIQNFPERCHTMFLCLSNYIP